MNRFWVRTAAGVSVLAAVAVAAPAAQAKAVPTGAPDASALRAAGVKVTWPLVGTAPVVAPGSTLAVRVQKVAGKRGVPVRVALVRVNAKGRQTGTVSSATTRRGTIKVVVPKAAGRSFALTLRAGKLRHVGRFSTTPAAKQSESPYPLTVPEAVPGDPLLQLPLGNDVVQPCDGLPSDTGSAVLHLALTSVAAGQPVPYSIENTGPSCLTLGLGYQWQRLVDGTWTDVDQPLMFPAIAFFLTPHATWNGQPPHFDDVAAQTETDFVPGRYRLVTAADYADHTTPHVAPDLVLTAEIDVVAPVE